jgi:hypothetical protein
MTPVSARLVPLRAEYGADDVNLGCVNLDFMRPS